MHKWLATCVGIALGCSSPALWAAAFTAVFINPGRSDEPFWRSATRFVLPAAQQLDVQLEVMYAERDHLKMIELARQVAARPKKPDYLLVVNEKLAGVELLKLADRAGIKTLMVYSTLDDAQVAEVGRPRQKFHTWLGSLTPNAVDAGRLTAEELVRQALQMRAVADDGKVHVAAIAGDKATPTGNQRLQGAIDTFAAHPSVVLEQVVYGNWDRARANEQAAALLLRYPKLNAFWSASDLMAYGAIDAAEAAGRKPGADLLVSAINNSPPVLQARIQGRISALAGGHFTAAAWGLVMLYDYHHGKDFKKEGLELVPKLFVLLDEDRAQRFLARFGDEDFSAVDFRQFSKHLNPQLRTYQFSLLPALK
ncbi:sugar ABC transporter substrate-binding protein [Herbaspirillum sp. HC18]|nr:sugar ABC transporter substrate-binding protein [Herbaspirillum sp. HC18]